MELGTLQVEVDRIPELETQLSQQQTEIDSIPGLKTEIGKLQAEVDKIPELEIELSQQQAQINDLESNSEDALDIRRRYLEFRRRIIKPNEYGQAVIDQGNKVAHHGNAQKDASLFAYKPYPDPEVFEDLYGLSYFEVLEFGKQIHRILKINTC